MIKTNFSPVRSDEQTTAELNGLVLTVNGEAFELSDIPDGATVQHPVIQNCTRTGDDYELTVTLTHGPNAPEATRFPEPVIVTDAEWALEYTYEPEPEVIADDLAE